MTTTHTPTMHDHAMSYAKRGYHIFPVWWINDFGTCGCGNRNCKDPGKHPIPYRGVWDATTDSTQIAAWWAKHPRANIGWHPGPSGHLAMDLDKYKDEFDATATGAIITKADEETLTSLTGGGGNHLGYATPAGEKFGSNRSGLPKGIDIRCWGGYIILPPSNHKSGNRYQWETGYGPDEMTPAPLPQKLYDILKAAQQTAQAAKVTIKANLPEPDVEQWRLPGWLIEDLDIGHLTADRSDNDWRVMCALAERGLSDDDITAVWQHYPIGKDGKYADDGDRYLSMTLGKVRAKVGTPVGQYNGYQNGVYVGVQGNPNGVIGNTISFGTNGHPHTNGNGTTSAAGATQQSSTQTTTPPSAPAPAPAPNSGKARKSTSGNTANILQALDAAGYSFRMNELDDSIEVNSQIISDGIASEIRCVMRDKGFNGMEALKDAYTMNAYHNRYHPIKDFLGGLTWDGNDHIADLAAHFINSDKVIDYPDGKRATVIHAFLKRWLVGAVAKVYAQAQNITLTLAGPQGIGKSYVASWLCSPIHDYFNEGQLDPDGKETDRRLATTWIWEIGELGATTRRSDVNALKNKLTQGSVKFRVPYGHYDVIKPVLTSFIGTVNPDGRGFLIDKTGNRRFAVVNIESIDFAYTRLDPCQVWAQAVALFRAGEPWRLTLEETTTQTSINTEHQAEDTIDMLMYEIFYFDRSDDNLKMEPFRVSQELLFKNYAKDLDKCSKDAAAWLKAHGHIKKGRPPTWRGIRLRLPNDAAQNGEDDTP